MDKQLSNVELMKKLWQYARPNRLAYNISILLMFSTLGLSLLRPFLLKEGLQQISEGNLELLQRAAWIFLGVLLCEYISRSIFSFAINGALLQTISRLREALFAHILRFRLAYFDKTPVGVLLARTISDTESLGESLRSGVATILIDILTIIGIFIVMAQIDLSLTPVIFVATPIVLLTVRWFGKKLRTSYLKVRKVLAENFAYIAEGINGVEITQLFNNHQRNLKDFHKLSNDYRRATIWNNVYDAGLYAVIDGSAALVVAGILYWAFGPRFGLIHISVVIVYIDLIERIFVPIRDLSGKFATIQRALAALQRIYSLLAEQEQIIPSGEKSLDDGPLHIEFANISFRYGANGPQVLKNVDFTIEPGQTLALVGATGSGKTTIGRLLTRAYDNYQGEILINGYELHQLDLHQLRSKIAVVHQDVTLFPGSIRENITLGNTSIDEETLQQAIEITRVSRIIADLPNGLDFEIRENSGNLSAGQAQLIVFARAMAHNAPVVLMDEATANIDSLTESWIQEALDEIFKRKTVIVVAHRLSTIAKADLILVMQKGEIVQRGTHQQLLAQEHGYYAELVQAGMGA